MSVEVDFLDYGWIYLGPGAEEWRWFTWIYDEYHWARISALPWGNSPSGAGVQILEEWATPGTLWVHFKNISTTDGVSYRPTVIVAPSRY